MPPIGKAVRCGSKIVSLRMTIAEVLKYCGDPTSNELEEHAIRSSIGRPKVAEFDQNKLAAIK